MFRGSAFIDALVIDFDSFTHLAKSDWRELQTKYKCLFMTTKPEIFDEPEKLGQEQLTIKTSLFSRPFLPNIKTHKEALSLLDIPQSRIAYVSQDLAFLQNAMSFFTGTILVKSQEFDSYAGLRSLPDWAFNDFEEMKTFLMNRLPYGFFGEMFVHPIMENQSYTGTAATAFLDGESIRYPVIATGRYYGQNTYMHGLHPLSAALYFNKNGKASQIFDNVFAELFSVIINNIVKNNKENTVVCSVPSRPKQVNRNKTIMSKVSIKTGLADVSSNFKCKTDYPKQKNLPAQERIENVEGVFSFISSLSGKDVILIDDIITTGSTVKACAEELRSKGANEVTILVLGANQMTSYYSPNELRVNCSKCGRLMRLLVNSRNRSFFYGCTGFNCDCKETIDFQIGYQQLISKIDNEFV